MFERMANMQRKACFVIGNSKAENITQDANFKTN